VPGDVFHVDSLVFNRQVVFAVASRYGTPPMAVAHEGGIFVTRTLADGDENGKALKELNARLLDSFGLRRGARTPSSSAIATGRLYFLETSARVGGAFIVDVVEAATGLNLWREWAKIEIAGERGDLRAAGVKGTIGGNRLSLARQEEPDMSAYTEPEIVTRCASITMPA
jgi:biotin carboxylase